MSSLPDFLLRNKKQFLEMMADPRPFAEIEFLDSGVEVFAFTFG
jgi:hypothetical protein